jgi:lipopolysaccharide export system permease protein
MRMSGISLLRLSMPAITIGVLAALATFLLDNYVVPTCFKYTRALRNYAISEMNLPAVQENFMYKQFDDRQQLKRLLYVSSFDGNKLGYSTLIDLTNPLTLQVTQARAGYWGNQSIELKNANVYTVSSNQKLSNTTQADYLELQHFIRPQNVSLKGFRPAELSFFKFWGWLENRVAQGKKVPTKYYVEMWEKLTIPLTSLPLVLIAVPLSLTSPRKLNNIGFPAAIVILFLYYVLRHLSVQMGEIGLVTPLLAATLPLIVLGVTSALLYQRKSRVL